MHKIPEVGTLTKCAQRYVDGDAGFMELKEQVVECVSLVRTLDVDRRIVSVVTEFGAMFDKTYPEWGNALMTEAEFKSWIVNDFLNQPASSPWETGVE